MEEDAGGRKPEAAAASKAQRDAAAAGVSVTEWLQHVKASFLGLVIYISNSNLPWRNIVDRVRVMGKWLIWFDRCVRVFQVRKVTARSEQEAAEADMLAAKAQVEATDEAEARKKQLADADH